MRKVLLVLLFVVSVLASNEEIGKLFYGENDGQINDAVLSSNEKTFYTFKDGLISKYMLSPLKKIYSFQIPIEPPYDQYTIYVTSNDQKMVVTSKKELILVDLQKQKIIHRVVFSHYSYRYYVMNGMNFITVNRKVDSSSRVKGNLMTVWDTEELKKKKEIKLYDTCKVMECSDGYHSFADDPIAIYKINNRLIYISVYTITIFNAANLDIMKKVYRHGDDRVSVGHNGKFIYANCYTTLGDDYKKIHKSSKAINLETGVLVDSEEHARSNSRLTSSMLKNYSFNDKIELLSLDRVKVFRVLNKKYKIFQFKNGELMIYHHSTFEVTSPQIRIYLKMKTKDGRIVPMNKVTFNKYHAQMNLGE